MTVRKGAVSGRGRAGAALAVVALLATGAAARAASTPHRGAPAPGFLVQHDSAVAARQPAPHGGGGASTGYSFFEGVPGLGMNFRKRALHPGAAIGYHLQEQDEIYYVLSGTGEMRVDEHRFAVGPGTAVLTRSGSSHGLRQTGAADLVLLIAYGRTTGPEPR